MTSFSFCTLYGWIWFSTLSEIFSIWLDIIQCKTVENGWIVKLKTIKKHFDFATRGFTTLLPPRGHPREVSHWFEPQLRILWCLPLYYRENLLKSELSDFFVENTATFDRNLLFRDFHIREFRILFFLKIFPWIINHIYIFCPSTSFNLIIYFMGFN